MLYYQTSDGTMEETGEAAAAPADNEQIGACGLLDECSGDVAVVPD
jgi:hypothetical protein